MEKKNGVGICTVIGIVFIILKLCGVLTWSWLWILCPFWIPWVILILWIIVLCIDKWMDDHTY